MLELEWSAGQGHGAGYGNIAAVRVLPGSGESSTASQPAKGDYQGINIVMVMLFAVGIALLAQRLTRKGGRK